MNLATIAAIVKALGGSGSSGGGGSGGGGVLVVTVTETHETVDGDPFDVYTLDKTYTELNAALSAGVPVWVDGSMIIAYGGSGEEWGYTTTPIVNNGEPFTNFFSGVDHPYPAAFVYAGSN